MCFRFHYSKHSEQWTTQKLAFRALQGVMKNNPMQYRGRPGMGYP